MCYKENETSTRYISPCRLCSCCCSAHWSVLSTGWWYSAHYSVDSVTLRVAEWSVALFLHAAESLTVTDRQTDGHLGLCLGYLHNTPLALKPSAVQLQLLQYKGNVNKLGPNTDPWETLYQSCHYQPYVNAERTKESPLCIQKRFPVFSVGFNVFKAQQLYFRWSSTIYFFFGK